MDLHGSNGEVLASGILLAALWFVGQCPHRHLCTNPSGWRMDDCCGKPWSAQMEPHFRTEAESSDSSQ